MVLTIKSKIYPDEVQAKHLEQTTEEYIQTVNKITNKLLKNDCLLYLTSKDIDANLPGSLKTQAIMDARNTFVYCKRRGHLNTLIKAAAVWNNQNWRLKNNTLSFPVWMGRRAKSLHIKIKLTDYQKKLLEEGKKGTLRIMTINDDWYVLIAVKIKCKDESGKGVMGIDLGVKCPAVAVTDGGKTHFFGNGHKMKYEKRQYATKFEQIKDANNKKKLEELNQKYRNWLKDQDHKLSRDIINFAVENKVGTIKLEDLKGMGKALPKIRMDIETNRFARVWAFKRIANYIDYKAKMVGIKVVYIDPAYTSQTCPECGKRNKTNTRSYVCKCGFRSHRDRVAAINIMRAPVTTRKG